MSSRFFPSPSPSCSLFLFLTSLLITWHQEPTPKSAVQMVQGPLSPTPRNFASERETLKVSSSLDYECVRESKKQVKHQWVSSICVCVWICMRHLLIYTECILQTLILTHTQTDIDIFHFTSSFTLLLLLLLFFFFFSSFYLLCCLSCIHTSTDKEEKKREAKVKDRMNRND